MRTDPEPNTLRLAALTSCLLAATLLAPANGIAESDDADSPSTGQGGPLKSESPESDAASDAYQRHTAAGRRAYDDGDYAEAIDHFRKAYEIRQNPNILYNIGRAHEERGDFRAAIEAYERFLDQPDIPDPARADARQRIDTLSDILDDQQPQSDASTPNRTPNPNPQSQKPNPQTPKPKSNPGPILLISGATLLTSGAVFTGLTAHEANNARAATTLDERRQSARRGRAFAIAADTSLALGTLAAATGAALWLPDLLSDSDTPRNSARLSVSLSPTTATLQFSF